jgi:hypothetical protein
VRQFASNGAAGGQSLASRPSSVFMERFSRTTSPRHQVDGYGAGEHA